MGKLIDRNIKVPLHYQIYLDILKRIQTGEFRPGEKLPSESELQKIYEVSRITVRSAVEMLAQEGIVKKHRGGKGTVVCHGKYLYDAGKLTSFTDDAKLYGEHAGSELIDFMELVPYSHVADQLGLRRGEKVYYIERKRYRQNIVVGIHKAYIKKINRLKLEREQFTPDASLYALLRENEIIPSTAQEIIKVKVPSERILRLLQMPSGKAVFCKERITYIEGKKPFEYVEMYYNPDYYQYKIELRLN
ncbi:MAG: GntR family transcriptional regulator [Eubacteriales bacterium]|nr:GntR family transcriptional regulator [Eubacteriales bacterium]